MGTFAETNDEESAETGPLTFPSQRPTSDVSNQRSSSTLNEDDLRPSVSGISKRKRNTSAVSSQNNEQLKRAFDGLDQCLKTIATVKSTKADDEFQILANYMASELRSFPDLQIARQFKSKLQVFFTNGLMEIENEMVRHF